MLFILLKLHKPLLIFLAKPLMSYTDALDVIFKSINMHLVATSPIINKATKLWCLSVSNLVQNFLVNDQFIFVTCLLHDKCFSFAAYLVKRLFWRDLSFFIGSWCILGYFNVLLPTNECKGGWLLIRFLVMNSLIGLLVCILLDLVILGVMRGEGYTKFIENWIGLYAMECAWMNQILVKNCSVHSLILTSLASNCLRKVSNFCFFSMWIQDIHV